MNAWKTTALLTMGMLAGMFYATACGGMKLSETGVALASEAPVSAYRAVFEIKYLSSTDCGLDCECPEGFTNVGGSAPGGQVHTVCLQD